MTSVSSKFSSLRFPASLLVFLALLFLFVFRVPIEDLTDKSADSLPLFSPFFLSFLLSRCGNASQGPYCSSECRASDSNRPNQSPDFSPALSAVPPLMSSAKSNCSTPPSSVNNSPSPIEGLMGEEPPEFDLPALAAKFDYGGASLPIGLRFPPSTFAMNYPHPNDVSYPAKELTSSYDPADLTYRRKPGMPHQIPAPLYYRQTAALHSPSMSSPPRAAFSPRFSPARLPSISSAAVSAFALPPAAKSPSFPSNQTFKLDGPDEKVRRPSFRSRVGGPIPDVLLSPRMKATSTDLLLSPRIRALRSEEIVINEEPEEEEAAKESVVEKESSAFASYLFSQLAVTTPIDRDGVAGDLHREGRSLMLTGLEEKRSLSVDSVFPATRVSLTTTTPTRPTRFLFARGSPTTSHERVESADKDSDVDFSPPQSPSSLARHKLSLTPGGFMSATTDSASNSAGPSPFPSPPPSPPTMGRGRSHTRHLSDSSDFHLDRAESSGRPEATPDPRGRSKLRVLATVQRDLSPSRNDSNSGSRGRRTDLSREGLRLGSKSRARSEREEAPRGRGRKEEIVRDASEDEEEEEESRGRGRSRSRSRSLLRRGRGQEIAISSPAYGHFDDNSP